MVESFGITATPALTELVTGSPPEAIEQAFTWIDTNYGNSVAYLQSGGMTDADLAALRAKLAD